MSLAGKCAAAVYCTELHNREYTIYIHLTTFLCKTKSFEKKVIFQYRFRNILSVINNKS